MAVATSYASEPAPPLHVAIIMDGNGRWAKARGLPRIAGHRRGVEAVRSVLKACPNLGVRYLTIYAFSSENWKRPVDEIHDLMGLFRVYLRREISELNRQGVRIGFVGDRSRLSADIGELIDEAERTTQHNAKLTLTIAVNYGGRQEILDAARRIAEEARSGALDPADISETMFADHLHTAALPDPDLLIRTSGEQRLSNFLLWQSAYTELVFTPTLWPDFTGTHLAGAIEEYRRRDRRYGGTGG